MTDITQPLWPQTIMVLLGTVAGLWLHLKWHPLRERFSEALTLLQEMPWLVLGLASGYLMVSGHGPWCVPAQNVQWASLSLKAQLVEGLPYAGLDLAKIIQGLVPPWPLALGLPVLCTWLLLRPPVSIRRASVRKKKRADEGRLFLALLAAVSWLWLVFEGAAWFVEMPVWFRWIIQGLRLGMEAYALGLAQVGLITWVILREECEGWDLSQRLHHLWERIRVRWRGVSLLAALAALWIMAWRGMEPARPGLAEFLMVEAALLFAVLPVAVAMMSGSVTLLMARVMQTLRAAVLPLLAWGISALAVLVLAHFSVQSLTSLLGEPGFWHFVVRIFNALVLATMHSWLFLALVLTLLRHGLNAPAHSEAAK